MKYVILLGDGMADDPQPEKAGRTPLELAHTPNMDRIAQSGLIGMVRTVAQGQEPGSDVANMSILGYDPARYYTGRAAIEAAAMGLKLKPGQVALRCNLVTLDPGPDGPVMQDYCAGHISTDEAKEIISTLNKELVSDAVKFYSGVGFRNLLLIDGFDQKPELSPPHDFQGRPVSEIEPRGPGADYMKIFQRESQRILKDHPVNRARRDNGLPEANSIWLWGLGTAPALEPFKERFGLSGAVITGVDLIRGLGRLIGFEVIEVPGATGWIDTNYEGKAEAGLKALDDVDLVFLHVEAPDESGHEGRLDLKTQAIEDFDKRVVGPVMDGLKKFDAWRVMVLPDHETPIKQRNHRGNPVPFAVVDISQWPAINNPAAVFSEAAGRQSSVKLVEPGYSLIKSYLIR